MGDESSRKKCNHEYGWPDSTIVVERRGDEKAWRAKCTECLRYTDACATFDEAVERAMRGWWAL